MLGNSFWHANATDFHFPKYTISVSQISVEIRVNWENNVVRYLLEQVNTLVYVL